MNETNYIQNLIMKIVSIVIYIIFIVTFIKFSVIMFSSDKTNITELVLILLVIGFILYQLLKSIKRFISIIKEIKENRKFNIYVRNIGQLFLGLFIITFILMLISRYFKYSGHFTIFIIVEVAVGSIILIIDRVLELVKINNVIFEYDKSDE